MNIRQFIKNFNYNYNNNINFKKYQNINNLSNDNYKFL